MGAVVGGSAGGAAVGAGLGLLELNPVTVAIGAFLGGAIGGAIGYDLFSGAYEQLWDIFYETR